MPAVARKATVQKPANANEQSVQYACFKKLGKMKIEALN